MQTFSQTGNFTLVDDTAGHRDRVFEVKIFVVVE